MLLYNFKPVFVRLKHKTVKRTLILWDNAKHANVLR